MKLEQIEQEVAALSERDRVDLVCRILDTLPPPNTDVSDEEVLKRDGELENGAVLPLSHEEFIRVRGERNS